MKQNIKMKDILASFELYLRLKWKWLGLPPPTELQLEIAEFYQRDGIPRKIIQGFRGIAKTWIVASYAEWRWLNNPDYRIMIVSGNQQKADEISNFIKRCIEEFPLLKSLKHAPHEKYTAVWGVKQFNVRGAPPDVAPSCKSASISGMITGSRAHEVIGDDVEIPGNSATVMSREKLVKQVEEFESILLPGGKVTLLGTPQTEETVYRVFETRGYEVRRWIAEVPTPKTYPQYHGTLSPRIKKMFDDGMFEAPTEPTRFPTEVLLQKKAGMSLATYKLQFMLDTSLSDADKYPLKLKDILVTPLTKEEVPVVLAHSSARDCVLNELPQVGFSGDYFVKPAFIGDKWKAIENKVLFLDPSGRGDNETALVIGGTVLGKIYLLKVAGYLDGYSDETLDNILQLAQEYNVTKIVFEDNFGDGMFGKVLRSRMKVYKVKVEGISAHGNKEKRIIDTLEPLLRQHKLVVDYSVAQEDTIDFDMDTRAYSLFYQLSRATYQRGCLKYDDRIDVLAAMVSYYAKSMVVDADATLEQYEREKRQKAFNDMLDKSILFKFNKESFGYEPMNSIFNNIDPRSKR